MPAAKSKTASPAGNAVIGQSGGPTVVINQSLVGAIEALRQFKSVRKIYGMRHGVSGLTKSPPALIDLGKIAKPRLEAIARTPAAALGSSRDKPDAAYCAKILEACRGSDIRYFFYIGGNDSSDTCRIVNDLAKQSGYDLRCFHIPKTVDNDLVGSDHTPGFASAARFLTIAFTADNLDNASLPGVKINVVMGRHAGFLTAASALARFSGPGGKQIKNAGPHLVYLPEVPFDSGRFIADVQEVYSRLGRCQVAVSEGIQTADGKPVAESLIEGLERDAHGNIQLSGVGGLADALADLVKKNVKTPSGKQARVRADTFGYLQRCWPVASEVDAKEARAAARFAVKLARQGHASGSVAIVRTSSKPYRSAFKRIELAEVAGKTRHMPPEFIRGHNDVSPSFLAYLRPLVGRVPSVEVL